MRANKFRRVFLGLAALIVLAVAGYGQNNTGGKGSGGGATPPSNSGMTDSLTMSQVNVETGGTEIALAVVKNTGTSAAIFKIDTQLFSPESNGGSAEEQANTKTLNPGQSLTQSVSMMPDVAGQYTVICTFSVNGVATDEKTGTFNAITF